MKKLSTKGYFALISMLYLSMFCLQGCQKEMQINNSAGAAANLDVTNSNIIYTDVNPDVTETGSLHQYYYLDLNNDSTADFKIEAYWGGYGYIRSTGVRIYSITENEVACDSLSLPLAMNPGHKINAHLNWVITNPYDASINHNGALRACSTSSPDPWGNWVTTKDHYLGLKIKQGSNTYYG